MLSLSASLYLRWERPRMKSVNINSFKHEGAYYLFDSPVTTAQSWWWLTTEAEAMWVLPNLQIQVHVCMQTLWQLKPFVAQALELLWLMPQPSEKAYLVHRPRQYWMLWAKRSAWKTNKFTKDGGKDGGVVKTSLSMMKPLFVFVLTHFPLFVGYLNH